MQKLYTPGPWEANWGFRTAPGAERDWTVSTNRFGGMVIRIPDHLGSEVTAANAKLIAAAPDLLESLQWLVKQIPELKGEISLIGMQKCYDAILKATS